MFSTTHIPGIHATSFTVPGGNGFSDLEVLATDPFEWVQTEIAKRNPFTTEAVATEKIAVKSAAAPGGFDLIPDWLTSPEYLEQLGKGIAIKLGLFLVALVFLVFGVLQLTKD